MKFHSARCFLIARLSWEWLLISLALDIAFLDFSRQRLLFAEHDTPLIALGVLTAIALIGFQKEIVIQMNQSLVQFRHHTLASYAPWILGAVVLISMAEVVFHVGQSLNLISVVIALLVSIPVGIATFRRFAPLLRNYRNQDRSAVAEVERNNLLSLTVAVIPMAAARLISVLGLIAFPATDAMGLLVLSFVLILSIKPEEKFFRGPCSRCHSMTARSLVQHGTCPVCAPHLFIPQFTQPAREPAPK